MKSSVLFVWASTLCLVFASAIPDGLENTLSYHRRTETNKCHHDNCFRQLLNSKISAKASAFCTTYTTAVVVEPTAIPDYLNNCEQLPSRVSSACSCLVTQTSSSVSVSQTSTQITTSKSTLSTTTTTKIKTTTSYVPTPGCTNGPKSRACWHSDFNIGTDSDFKWPNTGKTVTYHFEIKNVTLSPDGTPKRMLTVNGQYPGPLITANWGDFLEISVKNSLQSNGTSMHWHGFRQLNTNSEDGADGVTECPIPPGETRTYKFRATQHGTSWYHSHFVNQYGDGIVGPIVIKGPATENYDHDLGALPISDHYYQSMFETSLVSRVGVPPFASNGLINGKNKNPDKTAGEYHTQSITPGKTYRLRLINTSVLNAFRVNLDSHKFTVIAADFVPIVPYTTDSLLINIGQRYDVIFTASTKPDNYWFRAIAPVELALINNNEGILAIFNNGVKVAEPTTKGLPLPQIVEDEKTLVPYIPHSVPRELFSVSGKANLTVTGVLDDIVVWTISGTPMKLDLGKPTLSYIERNDLSHLQNPALQVFELPNPDTWQFILIQNPIPVPHPLHLHGHDFSILGSSFGPGVFTNATVDTLNFENPTRRDTINLPGGGWVVLAFKTDNPGAWLFHCHIVWHTPEGMAIQFLERPKDIKKTFSLDYIQPECKKWDNWFKTSPHPIYPPL